MPESKEMTIHLTLPDVLMTGIRSVTGHVCGDDPLTSAMTVSGASLGGGADGFAILPGGEGEHWHRYKASATRRAHEIRMARIAELEEQIEALKGLDFGATTGGFRG